MHMIAETHRHAGHADIVRELIDGAAGVRQDVDNLPPATRRGGRTPGPTEPASRRRRATGERRLGRRSAAGRRLCAGPRPAAGVTARHAGQIRTCTASLSSAAGSSRSSTIALAMMRVGAGPLVGSSSPRRRSTTCAPSPRASLACCTASPSTKAWSLGPRRSLFASFPGVPRPRRRPGAERAHHRARADDDHGPEWDEARPYTDPANSEIAMEAAPDRYRYILDRPIVASPAALDLQRRRDGPARSADRPRHRPVASRLSRTSAVLPAGDHRLRVGTGIGWHPVRGIGTPAAARDLARIGHLVLQNGMCDGAERSSHRHGSMRHCGNGSRSMTAAGTATTGTWVRRTDVPPSQPWIGAFGNGGQRLWIIPDLGLVVACTFGNYNRTISTRRRPTCFERSSEHSTAEAAANGDGTGHRGVSVARRVVVSASGSTARSASAPRQLSNAARAFDRSWFARWARASSR